MPGGAGAAFHLAAEKNKFSLGSLDLTWPEGNFWVMSLYGFFWYLQKYAADQTLVQRYLVAKSDRDALKGVALGASLCVPAWTAFMLVGTLLWAYYQLSGEVSARAICSTRTARSSPTRYSRISSRRKSLPGWRGFSWPPCFPPRMSTMSSDLNCLSAVGVEDYYCKLRPTRPTGERLAVGKIIVAVCGVDCRGRCGIFIAWKSESALSLYYAATSIVSAGLAGMFLLAFFSRRANRQGLWIGIVCRLLFTRWATLTGGKYKMMSLGGWDYALPDVMIGVIAHLIVLVVGWLASWFFPPETM